MYKKNTSFVERKCNHNKHESYLGDENIVVLELLPLHLFGEELLHDGRLQLLVRGLPSNWHLKMIQICNKQVIFLRDNS